ncbi:MAG: site-specific integrase, partial [Bacteroidales bacterium]|nr:site-specific integrase [Bacteroidales bacterium]
IKYSYYRGRIRYDEVYPKWQLLGTHGARRTFICVALELGIPTTVIRKITGHANEAAMRPYIAVTDKTIIEAMSKFSSRKTL